MPMRSRPFGLVGVFTTPQAIFAACEKLRDAGYRRFDAHTPFPVHGLERAMGLKASPLGWIVLACALAGGSGAFALQWWAHVLGYAQNISGKPLFAFQAYVPITFELTVLFAAFGTFFGVWGLSKLPRLFHPVMQHPSFPAATDDRFLISVEADDPMFDLAGTHAFLVALGAAEIEEVAP